MPGLTGASARVPAQLPGPGGAAGVPAGQPPEPSAQARLVSTAASDRPPQPAANITVFRPSSFFILVQTGLGLQLQVQLVPLMQVFLRLDPSYQGQMCGEASGGLGAPGAGQWGGAGVGSQARGGDWGVSGSPGTAGTPAWEGGPGGWRAGYAALTAGFMWGLPAPRPGLICRWFWNQHPGMGLSGGATVWWCL